MKILQAIAGAPHGGAERFFERLVPALSRAGIEQRVLIRADDRRYALLKSEGLDVHQLPFGGRFDLRTGFGFRRHIRDFRPDIVFTWMSRASQKAPNSPVGEARFVRVARLGGYYGLKYYRGCDQLIGDTQSIVDYLTAEGWPEGHAVYLPNFVSEARGAPIPRGELGVPEGVPLLLGLGRLHVNKAFDVLLKALALIPAAHLLLAGVGPEQETLQALAAGLGVASRVHFLGWRDDVARLFATVDLFVHPARHEPLGNVVIEAWAQGLPVVCAASQGPAVLIEDGVSGLLAPVEQPAPLAAAVNALLADPARAKAIAAAGEAVYRAHYTETAVVAAYQAFFERIAG
jgi:glycosyltransferase involved in cell wall biosynthesis